MFTLHMKMNQKFPKKAMYRAMQQILFIASTFSISHHSFGQQFPFDIAIDSIEIPQLGGLQSYSVAQANGKWLIIGGRLDGLHQRQPWASFDRAGNNTQLVVIDPISKEKWTAPLTSLSQNLQEQLSATNMAFYQVEDDLFLAGGYGFSARSDDHKTFPFLTVVKVSAVIEAIQNESPIDSYFKQIADEKMAVTGGKLQQIDGVFYLVGGHRFDGRYNPMNNPTFTQTYTNAIRKFTVERGDTADRIVHVKEIYSSKYLHRRDLNVLPQILPNGNQGLVVFSGVFQEDVDLPYLTSVVIDSDSFNVQPDFAQYYNHYHCAAISLFDAEQNNMHNLFFGGISQYYDSSGFIVQDNDVPFVKTIACVSRDKNGWMQEFKFPISMPAYLGAASEFIVNPTLQTFSNGTIQLNSFTSDTTLLGYIYGGIQSSAANIFWVNTGVESKASNLIYPVYLLKNESAKTNLNSQSSNTFQLQIYPNPVEDELSVSFTVPTAGNVEITVENLMGEIAFTRTLKNVSAGEYFRKIRFKNLNRGAIYYIKVTINGKTVTQKMLVN